MDAHAAESKPTHWCLHPACLTSKCSYVTQADLDQHSAAHGISFQDGDESSYFVLKVKDRAVIENSMVKGVWAVRDHARCTAEEQPHVRLERAQSSAQSVLLFMWVDAEHEWVGYATMKSHLRYEPENHFPHAFDVAWNVLLPRACGVDPRTLEGTNETHKCHNCDQLCAQAGCQLLTAIHKAHQDLAALRESEEAAHRARGFLQAHDGEGELEFHHRLVTEVETSLR